VVMTSYGRPGWLSQAVESVLGQAEVDLELIIVNNGSDSATTGYLDSLSDSRVSVEHHPENLGTVGGKNAGISIATGDWLALIDDDDVWAPDKLARQLASVEATGAKWSTTGCVYVNEDLEIVGGQPPLDVATLMRDLNRQYTLQAGMSAFLWRRGHLQSDLVNSEVPNMSDWDLALRLAAQGPPALVEAPLVAYRQHGTAMSSQRAEVFIAELERMAETFEGIDPEVTRPHVYQFIGSQMLRRDRPGAAARFYLRALASGQLSAVPRLVTLPLPRAARQWLRLHVNSDASWIAEAEAWLQSVRSTAAGASGWSP